MERASIRTPCNAGAASALPCMMRWAPQSRTSLRGALAPSAPRHVSTARRVVAYALRMRSPWPNPPHGCPSPAVPDKSEGHRCTERAMLRVYSAPAVVRMHAESTAGPTVPDESAGCWSLSHGESNTRRNSRRAVLAFNRGLSRISTAPVVGSVGIVMLTEWHRTREPRKGM